MSVAHEVTGNMMSTKERTLSLKSVHLDVEHCPKRVFTVPKEAALC